MGYSIDVRTANGTTTFSRNISHSAIRTALSRAEDVLLSQESHRADLDLPMHTLDALLPGQNGVQVTWLEAAVDAPKLQRAAALADDWILGLLAEATHYAKANQGTVCYG